MKRNVIIDISRNDYHLYYLSMFRDISYNYVNYYENIQNPTKHAVRGLKQLLFYKQEYLNE